MKTKNYLSMLAVMLVAMLSLGFVSCGDDDDDDNAAIGTWYGESHSEGLTLVFKSGGKGVAYASYNGERVGESESFTYKMKSNTSGTLYFSDYDSYYGLETYEMTFKIEDGIMYLYDDGVLEWKLTQQK